MNRMTRGNVLATIKELRKVKRPCARVVPASVQAIVGQVKSPGIVSFDNISTHKEPVLANKVTPDNPKVVTTYSDDAFIKEYQAFVESYCAKKNIVLGA